MSGCASHKVAHKPSLENLDTTTVIAREREDRYDPLVYCGGSGPYACPQLTPKTEYVPPAPVVSTTPNLNQLMSAAAAELAATAVSGGGSITEPLVVFDNVLFDFNKAELTPMARAALEKSALKLQGKSVELAGYTDAIGAEAYNDKLALQRANAVRDFLIKQNIPGMVLTVKGEGLCCYVSPNDSDGHRLLNRRVEIRVKAG